MTIENVTAQPIIGPMHVDERDLREWEEATSGAAEVLGHSLYGGKDNDKTLDALIGVPFVITHMTFREGDVTPLGGRIMDGSKREDTPRDYVSCEILIHPQHAPRFNRKYVIFNDGSTGIYRQVMKFLEARGDFVLDHTMPEDGDANTTRYDVSLSDGPDSPAEFPGNLKCPEGLRKSEYKGPAGPSATWYLA